MTVSRFGGTGSHNAAVIGVLYDRCEFAVYHIKRRRVKASSSVRVLRVVIQSQILKEISKSMFEIN